jgi:hypothetical protein
MINEFLSEDDVWAAHDASLAEPSKPAPAASSSRAFDLDKVVASTKAVNAKPKLVERTTKHRVLPEFEEESCMGLMAPKVSQLLGRLNEDGMRELARRNLRIGNNICLICAQSGIFQACMVDYANAEATCVRTGVVLHKVSTNEMNLMPYRPPEREDDIFGKTALDTFVTRKGYTGTPCGYCGSDARESTISHELVDVGQVVRQICYDKCGGDEWIKRVKGAVANGTPLPLRACGRCVAKKLHLKSTCLSNYAIVRKPRPRKKKQERDEEDSQDIKDGKLSYEEYEKVMDDRKDREASRQSVYGERMFVAKEISRYHASTLPTRSVYKLPDPDFSDEEQNDSDSSIWERYGEDEKIVKSPKDEELYYLPPYLSQMKEGFKMFDREFHSCLLNAAIGLNHLLNEKLLTAIEVKAVIAAVFNNSRWRMEREAGIKVQLVTRLGTMPGSPLKESFESANNSEFQNQLGTLTQAFVEEHLLSILEPVALGEETGRTHLQMNAWLDQMSGFGVGNQSSDALMIAVYWQWKNRGFPMGDYISELIPRLSMLLTAESMAFYDFSTWVPQRRLAEQSKAARPQAEHELYRLQTGDDQALCSSRAPDFFYTLRGYLHEEPDKKVYQSEGFCVYVPDDTRKKNKTWRYSKVKDVYGFRGSLLHRAGARLHFYKNLGFDKLRTDQCEAATQWLLIRPERKPAANGMRSNHFFVTALPPPPPVVISTETMDVIAGGGSPTSLQLHPKQKLTGKKPVSVITQVELPGSAVAAAALHHPVVVASKTWKGLVTRLYNRTKKAELKERFDYLFSFVHELVLERRLETSLGALEPPMTTPLAEDDNMETEMVRLKSPSPVAEKPVVEAKGKGKRKDTSKGKGKEKAPKDVSYDEPSAFVSGSRAARAKSVSAAKKKKKDKAAVKEMEEGEREYAEPSPSACSSDLVTVATASAAASAVSEAKTSSPVPCEKRGPEEGTANEDAKRPKQLEPEDPELMSKIQQMRAEHRNDQMHSPVPDEDVGAAMPSD